MDRLSMITLAAAKAYTDKSGGGSGTSNYNQLSHKPQINGVELSGNKSSADLSIPTAADLAGKQDILPVTASGNDVAFNGDIIDGQGNTLSVLAEALTKTASGNPVEITDCAGGKARSLKTVINALQDLHGLPFPYVGGAYKNLVELLMTEREVYGVTYTKNSDGSFSLNGTATANINFRVDQDNTGSVVNPKTWAAGTYAMSKSTTKFRLVVMQNTTFNTIMSLEANDTSGTVTLADTVDNCFTFIAINSGTRFDNEKFYIQIEKGNQATAWTPWENECPILGRDRVVVDDTGKNVWNYGVASDNQFSSSHQIKGLRTFTVSAKTTGVGQINVCGYNSQGTKIYSDAALVTSGNTYGTKTITVTEDLWLCIYKITSSTVPSEAQVEEGDTATPYEPYAHSSATIQLGQTVYGAEINWDTGVMTVKTAIVTDMGALDWTYDSANICFKVNMPSTVKLDSDLLSSIYPFGGIRNDGQMPTADYGIYIRNTTFKVKDTKYTDAAQYKTAVTGQTVVYELATPTTIQLTPEQLEMLKGYNRVTIESGTITLDYLAKTDSIQAEVDALDANKAEKTTIAPVENGTKASKAYAVGQHFIRDDKFCTAIAAIASGATLTLNTNYVEGTIADNLVKQDTFSGSTDSTGNIQISTNNAIKILSALAENKVCIPFKSSSGTYVRICQPHNMEPIPSAAVSGTYYYI